jgi:hypothetical protein
LGVEHVNSDNVESKPGTLEKSLGTMRNFAEAYKGQLSDFVKRINDIVDSEEESPSSGSTFMTKIARFSLAPMRAVEKFVNNVGGKN